MLDDQLLTIIGNNSIPEIIQFYALRLNKSVGLPSFSTIRMINEVFVRYLIVLMQDWLSSYRCSLIKRQM